MSSRVLRKLQGEKELNDEIISDPESDIPIGGARRKQLNINRYDLLNEQSHSESEVKEDDNETEANNAADHLDGHEAIKRKKKKKKKKSGKSTNNPRSSEDNAEVDEIEKTVREINKLFGDEHKPQVVETNVKAVKKSTLSVQHRHLNPSNELKRIFGSKIVQSEHKRKNRGRGHAKTFWFFTGKDNWPSVCKPGISMSLESKNGESNFRYEHSTSYQQVQKQFLEAVETLHPDNIVSIINNHPYHVDALIQLSDLCRLSEDLAMAAELIERALYCLEYAFHPLFNLAHGNCRLNYRRQENRAFYITLFKHLIFVGDRACYRTSLELCKVLLSIDPEGDPLAIVLAIDFYALRAKEYSWFLEFNEEWGAKRNLLYLPNIAFSLALAYYHLVQDENYEKADELIQDALIMFPGVLKPLLDKCSIQPDATVVGHKFFEPNFSNKQPPALNSLMKLYVCRTYHVWKEADVMTWLEKNVHVVIKRVNTGESSVKECEAKRFKRYKGTPRSILRHILLSDIKEVTVPISEDVQGPVMSFDPFPPPDSINLYTKPKAPTLMPQNSNTLAIFFRSLHPNFNVMMQDDNNIPDMNLEDEARGGPQPEDSNSLNLRRSVVSLVDAMRDLLNNVRLPDVPNDADVDENDDSEDDEEQNNYLT